MASAYFFDTSALLPRFLKGALGSQWVAQICADDQRLIAIAEITETEIASSLNQLVRGGTLRKKVVDESLKVLWSQVDKGAYFIIPVTSTIVRRAADLCSFHSLRGMDALQLACALSLRDDVRTDRTLHSALADVLFDDPIFLTEDNKLPDAAIAEGFVIDTPINHPSGS